MASVSPELHAWLHDGAQSQAHACPHHGHHAPAAHGPQDDQPAGDLHGCAVTLFSHGVVQQAVTLVTQPCEGILRAINHRAFERLAFAQPRFLHLPPQAPPAV